ncbi:MAG TPA: alkaline phosphatase family protein [Actinomycetales bacterium]|nr:alkaline phosphatase family protein [Actinomycetales bacterium]
MTLGDVDRRRSHAALLEQAVVALTSPDLAQIVDLVAWLDPPDALATLHGGPAPGVLVANHRGRVRLHHDGRHEVLVGDDPVASTDPMAFLPYEQEVADPSPDNERNAYPYPYRRISSLLSDPTRSPDLVVVHTPRHYFPDEGGHRGEHGSLDVVQSRAPLLLSGAGVEPRGFVDDHARLVDVGPTLAVAAGVPFDDLRDAEGAPLDGRPLARYLTAELTGSRPGDGEWAASRRPRWVVGLLWDGASCGDLLHLAGTGQLPAVARLIEHGVALRGGAVAEFPSITLTNHTSILTGVGPGRHGVLGNVFYDRATDERVVPNDSSTWHRSSEWLRPGVRTVFEMVADHVAARPDGSPRTASVDEAIDRGADYSTMAVIRASGSSSGAAGLGEMLPDPSTSPYLGEPAHLDDEYFAWATQVDDVGLQQVLQLFDAPATAPVLTWWASTLTDAGHHAGGPRSSIARDSLRDSDRRLQTFLAHLDGLGVTDDVLFVLTADHGFEAAEPSCTGSWRPALESLGVPFRDEGPGFVYLGVASET